MKYSELNEKRRHGTADFPIQYYRVDPTHPRYVMEAHWHTEAELIRVEYGTLDLYLNRNCYTLHPGDVAFVNTGVLHHGTGQDCCYECAVWKPEGLLPCGALEAYVKPLSHRVRGVHEYLPQGDFPAVSAMAEDLFSLLRQPHAAYELAVVAAVGKLYYTFYQNGLIEEVLAGRVQEKQIEQLIALLTWIEDHYTEHITLAMLSRTSGLNEKYLCRFFKTYTAHTPIDYINRLRIEHAADDIRTRHSTVTEAAFANGFNDSAYFCKLFRQIKGISPGNYRKGIWG